MTTSLDDEVTLVKGIPEVGTRDQHPALSRTNGTTITTEEKEEEEEGVLTFVQKTGCQSYKRLI